EDHLPALEYPGQQMPGIGYMGLLGQGHNVLAVGHFLRFVILRPERIESQVIYDADIAVGLLECLMERLEEVGEPFRGPGKWKVADLLPQPPGSFMVLRVVSSNAEEELADLPCHRPV